ncbi:hypothetical protein FAI41_03820 [Acetobacteraceae bacterium]|nr:hypothetical protein FAI41_03820 [Acetobacteraceae bacterium]
MIDLSKPRWIKAGQEIEISGAKIKDGMLYIGEVPRNSASAQTDYGPELINLALDIAPMGQFTMRQTGYWPSYDALAPSGRRAYLHWLSEGRRHKEADPGLVFLFFYGLERRILTSPLPLTAERQEEWQNIATELKALLKTYGPRSPSLAGYISRLLEWMEDFQSATDKNVTPKSLERFLIPEDTEEADLPKAWQQIWENIQQTYPYPRAKRTELPWRLRLALGQISRDAKPLSPPMALAWLHYHPDTNLRTPAARCPKQFDQLFMAHFAKNFPQWMRLLKSRTPLKKTYSPASHALQFHPALKMEFSDIPDISRLKNGLSKLEDIAIHVCDQLDLYSRALSKEPNDPENMDLQILLPFMLWPEGMQIKIKDLTDKITQQGAETYCFHEIFEAINPQPEKDLTLPKRLSLKQIQVLVESLKSLNIGVEPIPTKNAVDLSEKYTFFPYPFQENENQEDIPAFTQLFLQLGVALALSDAEGVNPPRREFLEKQLLSADFSTATDSSLRLMQNKAHILYLSTLSSTKIFNLTKKLLPNLELTQTQKILLLNRMIMQAKLTGMVSIGAIKFLEKIYKLFDQEISTLPSDVSRGGIDAPAPKSKTRTATHTLQLDLEKIEEKRQATEAISGILDHIFNPEAEKEPPSPASIPVAPEIQAEESSDTSQIFPDLDTAHRKMAQALIAKTEWDRTEIEALAEKFDLMAEGALEVINDAAFDLYDAPFIEGEDPFEINPEILEQFQA